MVPVRKTVEISEGVKVELLFTPRLSMYQETVSPLPALSREANILQVMERYADIMYFAALNAWELDGHGTAEDFPHKRGDFHGWMQADPKGFMEGMNFAVRAITGKTARELIKDGEKASENGKETPETGKDADVKKKSSWISRLTGRSKRSS